jgi:hypothetical protein
MAIVRPSTPAFHLHILLEQTETGRIIASIAELTNLQVEANTRKEALTAIQSMVSDRLNSVEVFPLEVSSKTQDQENPWIEFIGMFENDAEFAEMAAQWQADRVQDNDDLA